MTCANGKAIRIVERAERRDNVIEVIERLALAHKHNAGNALREIVGNVENLVDNLACRERTGEAAETGCTERTAHGASCLGGNADSELVACGHADRLDGGAIGELQQILAGTVAGDLFHKLSGDIEAVLLGKRLTQGLWEVGHLFKRTYVLDINPLVKLFCPKGRLAAFGNNLTKLRIGQIADITFTDILSHHAPLIRTDKHSYLYNKVSNGQKTPQTVERW